MNTFHDDDMAFISHLIESRGVEPKEEKTTVIHGCKAISVRWGGSDDFNIYKSFHTSEDGETMEVYTPPYQSIGGSGVASMAQVCWGA
jgi:hypothetical protein